MQPVAKRRIEMVLDYKKIEEFLQECKAEIDRLDAQYFELAKAADNMKH